MPQIKQLNLLANKKVYFISDIHFGIPDEEESKAREQKVCQWLEVIKKDAQYLFLLGDIFDTWMDYKKVIPRGQIRFLGKLAELSDAGVQLIYFTGNHDLWTYDFFEKELHAKVFHEHKSFEIGKKIFHVGHGDGIGPGDIKYKIMKAVLRNPFCRYLYRQLHPDLGIRIASFFSRLGPKHKYKDLQYLGDEKEYQIIYAKEMLQKTHIDYFIFGHRHIANDFPLTTKSQFINLGDWINYDTYAEYDGEKAQLKSYL